MKKTFLTFIIIFIPWILLTGFDRMELVLGTVVSLIVSILISKNLDFNIGLDSIPKIFKFIFWYIPVFIIELIKANVDIALRVLNPKLPINPGFVKIPTDIKNEYGKLILANSITLTPGTLTLDVDDEYIYIHWIDVKGETKLEQKENVSGSFERILGGIFK